MDITPNIPEGKKVIEKYGDNNFIISGEIFTGPVLVFPHTVYSLEADTAEALLMEAFNNVFIETGVDKIDPVDLLLVGCGEEMIELNAILIKPFHEHNIRVEPMDTGAVCRTYNVLLAEGRSVAAAMLPI